MVNSADVNIGFMNIALQKTWTIEQFLDWADAQEERYEFDGFRPVAMIGGNARHSRVMTNVHAALRSRLRGTPCSFFGPDLGVQTIGETVRYPDALVTCTKFPDADRLAPDVAVTFEVISPSSGRMDRITKAREYAAVPSMRRYIIVETEFIGLLTLHRQRASDAWTALTLTGGDTLEMPELGISVPVAEFYQDVDLADVTVPERTDP